MNSSSKVPPRFVPTLTEVVQTDALSADSAIDSAATAVPRRVGALSEQEHSETSENAARPSFHSPWLSDGLYVRSKPATIPHELPPLPDSLPPQQPFAELTEDVAVRSDAGERLEPESSAVEVLESPLVADTDTSAPKREQSTSDALDGTFTARPREQAVNIEVESTACSSESSMPELVEGLGVSSLAEALDGQSGAQAEEYLIHRLMQRVDLVLEERLKEAIAQVVEAQTRSMVLSLREEVESVVRQSVYEAVDAELSSQAKK